MGGGVIHRIVPNVSVLRYPQARPPGSRLREAGPAVLDLPRTEATAGVEVRIHTDPIQHHFVEILDLDLLHSGQRLVPYPELEAALDPPAPDYLVLLNRSRLRQDLWMDYTLYPVRLTEPLPCIPVPLAGAAPDVLLDLQVAFNRVYREGPYLRALDDTQPPEPPLSEADAAWAEGRLRLAGLLL